MRGRALVRVAVVVDVTAGGARLGTKLDRVLWRIGLLLRRRRVVLGVRCT